MADDLRRAIGSLLRPPRAGRPARLPALEPIPAQTGVAAWSLAVPGAPVPPAMEHGWLWAPWESEPPYPAWAHSSTVALIAALAAAGDEAAGMLHQVAGTAARTALLARWQGLRPPGCVAGWAAAYDQGLRGSARTDLAIGDDGRLTVAGVVCDPQYRGQGWPMRIGALSEYRWVYLQGYRDGRIVVRDLVLAPSLEPYRDWCAAQHASATPEEIAARQVAILGWSSPGATGVEIEAGGQVEGSPICGGWDWSSESPIARGLYATYREDDVISRWRCAIYHVAVEYLGGPVTDLASWSVTPAAVGETGTITLTEFGPGCHLWIAPEIGAGPPTQALVDWIETRAPNGTAPVAAWWEQDGADGISEASSYVMWLQDLGGQAWSPPPEETAVSWCSRSWGTRVTDSTSYSGVVRRVQAGSAAAALGTIGGRWTAQTLAPGAGADDVCSAFFYAFCPGDGHPPINYQYHVAKLVERSYPIHTIRTEEPIQLTGSVAAVLSSQLRRGAWTAQVSSMESESTVRVLTRLPPYAYGYRQQVWLGSPCAEPPPQNLELLGTYRNATSPTSVSGAGVWDDTGNVVSSGWESSLSVSAVIGAIRVGCAEDSADHGETLDYHGWGAYLVPGPGDLPLVSPYVSATWAGAYVVGCEPGDTSDWARSATWPPEGDPPESLPWAVSASPCGAV